MTTVGQPAIVVEKLVKEFRVYRRASSLKSHVITVARNITKQTEPGRIQIRRALDGINLRIDHGETVALVGRNGSGKSTLLSVLSRVYLPTSGEARLYGRLVSLLELGAGFDQELTGAQNVSFNATLMGLTQREVEERYDSILDFAELAPAVMDLPVRTYSSGMQLRLGFAVAIHLNADILLVDEGLAVGDEAFQEKCFAKMAEIKGEGKTILMVTHELDHIERIAERVLWMQKGQIIMDGAVEPVLKAYREEMQHPA